MSLIWAEYTKHQQDMPNRSVLHIKKLESRLVIERCSHSAKSIEKHELTRLNNYFKNEIVRLIRVVHETRIEAQAQYLDKHKHQMKLTDQSYQKCQSRQWEYLISI